jgi:hypothetical protein
MVTPPKKIPWGTSDNSACVAFQKSARGDGLLNRKMAADHFGWWNLERENPKEVSAGCFG